MPLLLRGLDLPDNEIRASVIDTLHAAAVSSSGEKDNAIVAEHASSLVSTMLKNCLVSQMPSVVSSCTSLGAGVMRRKLTSDNSGSA